MTELSVKQQARAAAVRAIYWAAPMVDESRVRAHIEDAARYIETGKWDR